MADLRTILWVLPERKEEIYNRNDGEKPNRSGKVEVMVYRVNCFAEARVN